MNYFNFSWLGANTVNICVCTLIVGVVSWVFLLGPFAGKKNFKNLSYDEAYCYSEKIIFVSQEGEKYLTSRKFSDCKKTLSSIEGKKISVHFSDQRVIHQLVVEGDVIYKTNALSYVVPVSFVIFCMFLGLKKNLRKEKESGS